MKRSITPTGFRWFKVSQSGRDKGTLRAVEAESYNGTLPEPFATEQAAVDYLVNNEDACVYHDNELVLLPTYDVKEIFR